MLAPDICHCPRGDAKVNLLPARLGFSSSRRIKEAKKKERWPSQSPSLLIRPFSGGVGVDALCAFP